MERRSSRLQQRKDVPTFSLREGKSWLRMIVKGLVGRESRFIGQGIKEKEMVFVGLVKAFDHDKRCHKIHHVDGEKEDLDLRQERFELEV